MATIKAYTDLEQSKKLAEILPLESADMCYIKHSSSNKTTWEFNEDFPPMILGDVSINEITAETLPCYSLAALRNLLPVAIKVNENTYLFESHNTFDKSWVYRYYDENDTSYLYCKDTSEIDTCVAMIEKLHELNLL